MQFAIAMLAVAAFLLITGVVGHDTEVGQGGIALKVHGKVGPVPRIILFIASAIALVLAVVSFLVALPSTEGRAQEPGSPSAIPTASSSSSGNLSQPTGATLSLLVGIRPQLGQVDEDMALMLDDKVIARWHADQANPSRTLTLHVTAGSYSYSFQGNYGFYDSAGILQHRAAAGSGEITLTEGLHLGVNYLGGDVFQLVTLP